MTSVGSRLYTFSAQLVSVDNVNGGLLINWDGDPGWRATARGCWQRDAAAAAGGIRPACAFPHVPLHAPCVPTDAQVQSSGPEPISYILERGRCLPLTTDDAESRWTTKTDDGAIIDVGWGGGVSGSMQGVVCVW